MSSAEPSISLDGPSNGSTEQGPVLPLPYQRLLLQNVLTTDALLIIARGLGLLSLISHLLYTYDNPEITSADNKIYKNFVVMIGAESREETLIGQNMAELVTSYGGVGTGLQVVNTDKVGVDQRYPRRRLVSVIVE
jgi:DNA excision repair protein ERCC-4